MSRVPLVREIMVEANVSVTSDMPAYKAIDMLVDRKLAGIPVIDATDHLVGFLTEKDCLRLQAISHQYNMTGRTVKDIMSGIKESLHPDHDILSASMIFLNCNFSALPVIEENHLVGSITRQGMLQAIKDMHKQKGRSMEYGKQAQKIQENPSSIFELQSIVAKSSREQLASVFGNRHKEG